MPAIRQHTVKCYSIQGFHLISREIKIHIQGSCPWGLVSMHCGAERRALVRAAGGVCVRVSQ